MTSEGLQPFIGHELFSHSGLLEIASGLTVVAWR